MAEVLGALGVIASLVFVGLEIRQSNAYARQEALSSMIEEWNSLAVPWALDERFSGLAERVNEGVREADLTGADRQSLHLMFLNVNQVWQFRYRQLQVGVISADDVQFPDPERNTWFNSDFHRDVWPYNRQEFDPGFAAFWEERFNLGGN